MEIWIVFEKVHSYDGDSDSMIRGIFNSKSKADELKKQLEAKFNTDEEVDWHEDTYSFWIENHSVQ